eukprot:TRINITY_DN249_c0_g1_i6.p2 TRINITY_DN249_c0_g1~~TRINITY_DN249_c0_g1_i6.p2  ORF type:complete len:108 (+),score=9.21 TRINITY_DN249_c0_g1_i6:53-376(+)
MMNVKGYAHVPSDDCDKQEHGCAVELDEVNEGIPQVVGVPQVSATVNPPAMEHWAARDCFSCLSFCSPLSPASPLDRCPLPLCCSNPLFLLGRSPPSAQATPAILLF